DASQSVARLIDQVMVDAKVDLTENAAARFSAAQITSILVEARQKLLALTQKDNLQTYDSIRAAWLMLVREFHQQNYWGLGPDFTAAEPEKPVVDPKAEEQKAGRSFMRQTFISMVIMKGLLLYFGAYYSSFPGEGYGYGLITVIILTLCSYAYLIWRFRHVQL
ncbi:MAG: hypothetical protein AB7K41_16495, partial [Bdellovibrionales bacterium]